MVHQVDNMSSQGIEPISSETQDDAKNAAEKGSPGYALHQIFGMDVEDLFPIKMLDLTAQLEEKIPSLWDKIYNWWYQADIHSPRVYAADQVDLLDVSEVEPISAVPILDEPGTVSTDNTIKLPPKKIQETERLSQKQFAEGLSRMSDKTIEQIMFIILTAQIGLEKDSANVSETTFTRYQDLQKLQEKVLQEIKDALAKDEKLASYFKKGQQAAFALSCICAAVALGAALIPAGLALTMATVVAPSAAAGLTAATTGAKAYYDRRVSEDQARHEQFNHQDKYYTDRVDESRERLMSIADNDNVFKERLIQLSKRFAKMCRLALGK